MAKLLPYGSELNGSIIEVPNVDVFKKKGVDKVSKQFNAELVDLKKKIMHLWFGLYFYLLLRHVQVLVKGQTDFLIFLGFEYELF